MLKRALSVTLLSWRDQAALTLLHQVCSWGKPPPCPTAARKSSGSSSMWKSSSPAEVWHSLCSWGLQSCYLWVTCSPEAAKRDLLPLPGLALGRCGCSLPTPEDCKIPTKHFMPLPRPSSLGNVSPAQGSAKCFSHPNPLLEQNPLFSFAANLWWFIFLPVTSEVLPDIT